MAIYGNSSMGFCGIPDNRHKVNNPTFGNSDSLAFAFSKGNRINGYYGNNFDTHKLNNKEWKQSGSGAWYQE